MTSERGAFAQLVAMLYVEACYELFAAHGLTVCIEDRAVRRADTRGGSAVSMLLLTGKSIRLSSALRIDNTVLAGTHPAAGHPGMPLDLEDWCREFSNQLGGRLKNRLLRLGCEVMLDLATLITGNDVSLIDPPDWEVQKWTFTSAGGDTLAKLAMQLDPAFRVSELQVAPGDEATLAEGTHLLF